MSTTEEQVWHVLKPYVVFVLTCWLLTIMVMWTRNTIEDNDARKAMEQRREEIRQKVEELIYEDFDDYMVYRRIFPPKVKVGYDDVILMVSDSAVVKAGFMIEWREKVECDNNPYDDKKIYEFYATGQTTKADQPALRDFPEDGGKYLRGWPVREWRDPKRTYKGPSPVLRYPDHDANCRVVSTMVQSHMGADGAIYRKAMTMKSEIAEVRGFN